MFEKLDKNDRRTISRHLKGILDILNQEDELEIGVQTLNPGISFEEFIGGHKNHPKPVTWDDICGKWSYNTAAFKELKDKIPPSFTIIREDESYLISFDDKRELLYRLSADDLEEGVFYFFIEACYFKLCYNPELKGIYIIPYFNYYNRSEK